MHVIAALESQDQQIDFNILKIQRDQSNVGFTFLQYSEVSQRRKYKNGTDEIEQIKFVFIQVMEEFILVSGVKRKSGDFDLYYQGKRVNSSLKIKIRSIDLTYDAIYLTMSKDYFQRGKEDLELESVDPGKKRIRKIELKWAQFISNEHSSLEKGLNVDKLHYHLIKNHCKLFSKFLLIETELCISHGNFLSFFNILSQKWRNHIEFDSDVLELFEDDSKSINVLLKNGSIKKISQPYGSQDSWWAVAQNYHLKINCDKIIRTHSDRQHNKFNCIISRQEDLSIQVNLFFKDQLFEITDSVFLTNDPNIVFLYSDNQDVHFMVQSEQSLDIYRIEVTEEEQENGENGKKRVPKFSIEIQFIEKVACDHLSADGSKLIPNKIIDGILYSNTHLILNDGASFYKIDIETCKLRVFENQNCIGLYYSDSNYIYGLCHGGIKKQAGLRLYSMQNLVQKDRDETILITGQIQVGCQGTINFNLKNQRLIYQQSFDKIEVIPLLHSNSMSFMCIKERKKLLAARVIDGKFIALRSNGAMNSWDLITGKLLEQSKNSYSELKKFEVYQRWEGDTIYKKGWYNQILLRSKLPIKDDEKLQKFDKGDRICPNQVTYRERININYHEFRVIEIESESEIKTHLSFNLGIESEAQCIYFSKDLQYMYVRLSQDRHIIYTYEQQDNANSYDKFKTVTWRQLHQFQKFPFDCSNLSEYPFLFSPNFKYYIDVDDYNSGFIIRDSFNSINNEKSMTTIPQELMSTKNECKEDVLRRFRWLSEQQLLIISREGIERVVDFTDSYTVTHFNFIPLYDENICKNRHYIFDHESKEWNDELKSLKSGYQSYKSSYYINKERDQQYNMNNDMFQIDQRIDNCRGNYQTRMSFSFINWNLIEQINSQQISLQEIDPQILEQLYYNILPGGNTLLHVVHSNEKVFESTIQMAHRNKEDRSQIDIHIPFLQNIDGKSPFHLLYEEKQYSLMNMLLEYLSGYDIDHHSRAISGTFRIMLEREFPNIIPYLESRIMQISIEITKGMLKVYETNHICAANLLVDRLALQELFQPAPIEQNVRLQFLDVSGILCLDSDNGIDFMKALSEYRGMKPFEATSIQKIIDFQWPLVYKYTLRRLLVPYLIFIFLFTAYMYNGTLNNSSVFLNEPSKAILALCLATTAAYLLFIEAHQFLLEGFNYIFQIWNYLDLVPPIMILLFMIFDYTAFFNEDSIQSYGIMKGVMTLFTWLKLLYFMRMFESTGYLIRIIIQVCIDMRHFLFILTLTFVAFGGAIQSISVQNGDFTGYLGGVGYVYRMCLGDFQVSDFDSMATLYLSIIFILCTLFNMVIMMNLLIAIISESFTSINSVAKQANYRERASIISENLFLVPNAARAAHAFRNSYLLMAIDIETELEERKQSADSHIQDLKQSIQESVRSISDNQQESIRMIIEQVLKKKA